MPATYSVQGKGSAHYARKTWMPEPPKPKQYFVLGIEVDRETYMRYETQTYSMGEDWNVSFLTLKGYANSEANPEAAKTARKILDQIKQEITKGGKTELNNPKNAKDYISALAEIYSESRTAYAGIQDKLEAAKQEVERTRGATNPIDVARHQLAQQALIIARDDYSKGYNNMKQSHTEKVRELRQKFAAYLTEHYTASPEKIDTATMQLLNTGICTAAELQALVDRHKDNPSMVRVIGSYAEKAMGEKRIPTSERVGLSNICNMAKAAKDGSRELEIFDTAANVLNNGLGSDAAQADRMHNHVERWLADCANNMGNLYAAGE